ncbi:2Fe-2S iron-sulfur cluster binding domain-containing protein [Lentibacillus sp. L22]|uniref:2Fe-2S iron-sulfur cluster binding domain-containing protein n=1 Tax=Lentibacillus TaxID=175304 RepID=UPI0022B170D8|nr:2Fe-2S iron-sulfur cluster binding domain-containing protein [Lentibacillus daqui]
MSEHYPVHVNRPDCEVDFEADSEEYLLYEVSKTDLYWPRACEQGWCLSCAAKLQKGEVDQSGAYLYYPEDYEAGFVLMCSAKPRSPLVINHDPHKTRREMIQHRIQNGLLTRTFPKPGWRRGPAKGKKN